MRVIFADDNEDHRFLIRRALREVRETLQLDVVLAADGQEALEAAWGEGRHAGAPPPGLAFLDIKMPLLDGFEVLAALRGDPRTRTLPVVMLTSSENARDTGRATECGADGYLMKPLDPLAFAQAVREGVARWVDEVRRRPG